MTTALAMMKESEARELTTRDEGFGALSTSAGNLPLRAVDVRANVVGLLAEVTLQQTFVNVHSEPLEATYIFPLPDRAAVTRFVMRVAGREIEGVLKERGQARRDYEQAIQKGHRAALAEEERPNTFTMRVGNLMPGEEAKVELSMTSPLPFLDGEATFQFPLVVAPRYIAGQPIDGEPVGDGVAEDTDAVPDASRISPPVLLPGFPNPVRLAIEVELDPAGLPVSNLRSALHAVEAEDAGRRKVRLSVKAGERLDRDFILRFAVAEKAVHTALSVKRDAGKGAEGGTFALTLMPPTPEALVQRPRDVVFVLDRSGSMSGWKMVAARRAMARMVDTLNDHDRLAVFAFDNHIETPPEFQGQQLVAATNRNRFRAVEFLAKVDAEGGTEMREPLEKAVQHLGREGSRDRVVVLLTDGQVGNEDDILRALAPKIAGLRIFTVGIDEAVNAGFLRRLAALGGGSCELVESEDRLDEVMDKIHRRFGTPVLTEVKLEADGLQIARESLTPARHDALFAGAPLIVSGRFTGKAKGAIVVQGRDAAGRPWSAKVSPAESANPAVAVIWARARVRDLEDRFVAAGSGDDELAAEIVKTSLEFGVLCRFTAFVAVDKAEVVNKGGKQHKVTQAVDSPRGWDMLKDRAASAPMAAAAPPAPGAPSEVEALASFDMAEEAAPEAMMHLSQPALSKSAEAPPSPMPARPAAPRMMRSRSAAPAGAAGGLLKKVFGGSRVVSEERVAPRLELGAYRKRAQDIRRLLEAEPDDDAQRLVALGTAAVQLAALVEDLATVGTPKELYEALQQLAARLQKALADGKAKAAELAALWQDAAKLLREFAEDKGGSGPAAPAKKKEGRRGGAFWK